MPDGQIFDITDGKFLLPGQAKPEDKIKSDAGGQIFDLNSPEAIKHLSGAKVESSGSSGLSLNKDTIIDLLRPFIGSIGGATAVGFGTGLTGGLGAVAAPVTFGAGYAATDQLMQMLRSKPSEGLVSGALGLKPGSIPSNLTNTVEQYASGKAIEGLLSGGKIGVQKLLGIQKGIQDVSSMTPAAQQEMLKYKPTTGQVFGGTAKSIEDTFAPVSKARALSNSAKIGEQEASQFLTPGRTLSTPPEDIAMGAQDLVQENLHKGFQSFENFRNRALQLAEKNTVEIPAPTESQPSGLFGPNGEAVMRDVPTGEAARIAGPIQPNASQSVAGMFLKTAGQDIVGNEMAPLTAVANKLANGEVVPFTDAFQARKAIIDRLGKIGAVDTPEKTLLQKFNNSLDYDIAQGMKEWKPGTGDQAFKAYDDAINQYKLHQGLITGGGSLRGLIDNQLEANPLINEIIDSPKRLLRTLSSGKLVVNGQEIATYNLRKELADYQWARMMNGVKDPKTGLYDINYLLNDSRSLWANPVADKVNKTLWNGPTRDSMEQFLKTFGRSQETLTPSRTKMWLTSGGIGLGIPVLSGLGLTGYGVPAVGVRLGLGVIGRLLNRPETASLLVKLAGNSATGMSNQFASKLLVNGLNGMTVAMIDQNGKETPGKIKDGVWSPDGN